MAEIKAADVAKLRKTTGSGMLDCKQALEEANGDFDTAIDILRKKGQKVANKRADRDATEGVVLALTTANNKAGVVTVLNCETDFVAKNEDFVNFAQSIANIALEKLPATLADLLALPYGNEGTINDKIITHIGVIGEKLDLSYYEKIEAASVVGYIHQGNRLASLVGFTTTFPVTAGKDVAMQIAAMNPVAVDKDRVAQSVIDKEIEIGKELAIQEGKPADMAEKIAIGRLNKFFKESTLIEQQFVKDNKLSVGQYITSIDKDAKVTDFKRYGLGN
ncbi:MAG TPA: elongation factor Ts [Bacteroidales bacterium]|nr:elongation factor Ts [Bacteroidales bacterium]